VFNEIYLELGKPFNVDVLLKDESQQLSEIKITVQKTQFSKAEELCRNYNRKTRINGHPLSEICRRFTFEPSASGGSFGGKTINITVIIKWSCFHNSFD
jgi:hypothetical protein